MGRVGNELWNYLPSAEGPRLAQPIQENIESGYDELNLKEIRWVHSQLV
jgi:hypothetical protein